MFLNLSASEACFTNKRWTKKCKFDHSNVAFIYEMSD
jgi:hypothetical protein